MESLLLLAAGAILVYLATKEDENSSGVPAGDAGYTVDVNPVGNGTGDNPDVVDVAGSGGGEMIPIDDSNLPRGIRNKNPGNLKKNSSFEWQGEIGVDDQNHVIFNTMENGIRAAMINLANYYRLHGIDTIASIVDRWATGNRKEYREYIGMAFMSSLPDMSLGQIVSYKMSEAHYFNSSIFYSIITRIFMFENGLTSTEQIDKNYSNIYWHLFDNEIMA